MKVEKGNISDLLDLISSKKKVAILTHKNPDGDAIGSSLALYMLLKKKGNDVSVVVPNGLPYYLRWMPYARDIIIYEKNRNKAILKINEADIIFCLDFNALDRISNISNNFINSNAYKVIIDHHPLLSDIDFAYYLLIDTKYSSTCEIMYDFINKIGFMDMMDKDIATCIYTGILTDTGGFCFESTRSYTHKVAVDLIDRGVKNAKIYNSIYSSNSIYRLNLLSQALKNLFLMEDIPVGIMYLSDDNLRENKFKKGYTEGFVNYILSIREVKLAVFLVEDKKRKIIKMSFRSKGGFDVNVFAHNNFNGGGHVMSAGGYSKLSLVDTINKLKNVVYEYKDKFNI